MSSMIATGGFSAPPANDVVPNNAWWPEVRFSAYREASRIDRTASDPIALVAIKEAIARVNGQLNGWLGNQIALDPSIEKLADLPDPAGQVPGYFPDRYLRAVHCATDALLAENFRDFDTTGEGDRRADAMEGRIDAYRRESQYAIADITGLSRRRIELL